jgi:hypothetical protein
MYSGDTGYFEYDDKYAPLCIKSHTLPTVDLGSVLQTYYNDTYSYGKKHAWAIQPSGISASEAAFLFMRGRMNKIPTPYRRKEKNAVSISEHDMALCVQDIVHLLKDKLNFNDDHAAVLQHILRIPNYYCNDIVPRILQQVKQFIKHYRLNSKQYTKILKSSQIPLSRIIEKFYDRNAKVG